MTDAVHLYKGLEVHPLVYPHTVTPLGRGHDYGEGFDAAVRIQEPNGDRADARSRVFRLLVERPFTSAGDARRASTAYGERLIDSCAPGSTIWDGD